MRNYIYCLLIIAAFASCKKHVTDPPDIIPNTNPAITPLVAGVGFEIKNQPVKVNVNNTLLNMNYLEDVTLVIQSDTLKKAWAVFFQEDFSKCQLGQFNYTTVNNAGVTVNNYSESNLNNIVIKSAVDTVINNVQLTKISFTRNFLFSNYYANTNLAGNEYSYLLSAKESVGFSCYLTSAHGKSAISYSLISLTYTP